MSFREKSIWVTFTLLVIAFVVYFGSLAFDAQRALGFSNGGTLFLALVLFVIVVEIVSHIVMGFRSHKDAGTPKDERERLIELRALRPAYYVMIVGLFMPGILSMPAPTRQQIAHGALFVFWTTELVRYGAQLVGYRRGV